MTNSSLLNKSAVIALMACFTIILAGCEDGSLLDTMTEGMGRQIQAQEQAEKDQKAKGIVPPAQKKDEVLLYEDKAEPVSAEVHEIKQIFMIGNIDGMSNGGTPAQVTLAKRTFINDLGTYHWNDEKGQTPGTIQIQDANGKVYGPWSATGKDGQGGVPNAYWTVYPKIELPAGNYTIIDSDPASWSQNAGTGGQGSTWANGYEVE